MPVKVGLRLDRLEKRPPQYVWWSTFENTVAYHPEFNIEPLPAITPYFDLIWFIFSKILRFSDLGVWAWNRLFWAHFRWFWGHIPPNDVINLLTRKHVVSVTKRENRSTDLIWAQNGDKKLIRRWDSERELSLRRHRTRDTKYNRVLHKFRHSSTWRLCVGTYVYQIQWNNAM